ncbi:MAG: hybrid sensor histidine kinase/response regulator [Thermodesulfobacteriota bacterium]
MNRILVVDDEDNNLKAIRRLLHRDYILEFAQNGDEALRFIPDFSPDLILLDIMMPGIDGYEVCRRLKSDSKTSNMMVLLVSARSALEDRLRGYEVGADDYIIKPYDPEELRAKVRILLRLKNAQDELRALNQNLEKLVEVETRELVKKERQAIIGQMVQGIVHNLRGPVTVVQARAGIACETARKLLEISKDDPDNLQKLVEKVIHNLDRLSEAVDKTDLLINSLLAKGRQEAAGERQRLNLNDIIVQEIKFLDADMDLKHGVKKYLNLDPSIPDLYGTYSDFSQVAYNLIKNASEAMQNSQKKELSISTRHDDENIYIIFQDTGSGISPDDLGRIFDPFFTTKPGRQTDNAGEPTGTGLGLYTCSQLMKYYGGEISVQSNLGTGTTFTIIIPKNKASAP